MLSQYQSLNPDLEREKRRWIEKQCVLSPHILTFPPSPRSSAYPFISPVFSPPFYSPFLPSSTFSPLLSACCPFHVSYLPLLLLSISWPTSRFFPFFLPSSPFLYSLFRLLFVLLSLLLFLCRKEMWFCNSIVLYPNLPSLFHPSLPCLLHLFVFSVLSPLFSDSSSLEQNVCVYWIKKSLLLTFNLFHAILCHFLPICFRFVRFLFFRFRHSSPLKQNVSVNL